MPVKESRWGVGSTSMVALKFLSGDGSYLVFDIVAGDGDEGAVVPLVRQLIRSLAVSAVRVDGPRDEPGVNVPGVIRITVRTRHERAMTDRLRDLGVQVINS